MKLTEKIMEIIQNQLDDPDKLENIKSKIIAPSLNLCTMNLRGLVMTKLCQRWFTA